ncbi:hypothetical protein SAMN05216259_102385 [Actinacidiphila guanduensis]|uniref:DUF1449 family protein n=1 Tax=Actinacidiphila guanduensis TaxID=310781 RepID=A0A1G9Y2G5_9ACTN|nr:hypothetical protein SAMN05216259_102385 [Actinacidiphila guanduensis]
MQRQASAVRGFVGAITGFPTVVFSFALAVVAAYWVLVLVGGAHLHGARGGHGGHLGHGGSPAAHGHGMHGTAHAGHGGGHGGHGTAHLGNGPGRLGNSRSGGHGSARPGPAAAPYAGHPGHPGPHVRAGLVRALGLGGVPLTVAVSLVVAFAWFTALAGRAWLGHGAGWLLPVALAGGWLGARVLVWPLRRLMPEPPPPPSLRDFVGLECVIRTGRVGTDFGQAEVRAADGSSAVVQVRQTPDDAAAVGNALRAGAFALIYDYDAEGEFFRVMPAPPPTG